MNEHSKKGSRTLLLLLLLLVCIVGAVLFFWLSGRPTADGADAAPESAPPSSDVSPVSQTIDPARQRYQFTLADSQEQETSDNFSFYQKYFWLGDRLVRLTPGESADVYLDLRDAASGEVVQSIPYDDVAAILEQEDAVLSGLSLEADGTLRLLTCSGDSTYTLWQCPQDGASPVTVGPCSFLYLGCEAFAVWDPYVVTLGAGDGQLGSRLCLYDLTDGSTETMEDVAAFCLDGAGHLYYSDLQSGYLICRDLTTGSTLWQQKANCRQLFYHPQYGLFACASRTGQIQCHDPETGKVRYELFAWNEDTTLDYEDSGISQANFAVDNQYQVYFSVITAENYEPPITYTQYRWTFSPYLAEDGATALTITAPYLSSSLDSTIRMFQKLHPEITITWDTAFASEEDFRTHVDQYSEQFSLRLMTGDVGDIILLSGYGLDTSAVPGTDVLLGLDDYLSDCSSLSDLNTDILDPLQDSSGTLRALPLALNPPYLIYNRTLADSLGLDWDPQQLTWSEILDLGSQWQADGKDLTLFGVMNSSYVDTLVSDMILVNLDDFQNADSARELAPLFETAKTLISSGQNFYRIPEAQFWWSPGFWDNTLFTPGTGGADYENLFYNISCAERDNNVDLALIPIPVGEDGSFRQSNADCFGISSRSEHADAAWEFLQFALSVDGFVGDLYDSAYALWNRTADQQRYAAVDDHGIPLEPETYQEYRALCDLPASRFWEPAGWIDGVWDPILSYLKDQKTLSDALDTAAENWSRQTAS